MAKKKPSQEHVELKVAEIRTEATQTQPEMLWHLPLVVTASGAGAALKGVELGAKGIEKLIEATAPPLRFDIQDSWLEDEHEHRVKFHVHNTTKNGIYIESFDIKREYLDPQEIDPNRTTQPTVWILHPSDMGNMSSRRQPDPESEYPLLVKPEGVNPR